MESKKKKYPRVEKRVKLQKQLLLEQLVKMPILEAVCKKVEVSRATVYRWRDEDPEFAKAYDKAMEAGTDVLDDVAESKLLELINRADSGAVFFYLKYRHHRYSAVVAERKERKLKELSESKHVITEEQQARIDQVVADMTAYQKSFSHVGLIVHDPPAPTPDSGHNPTQPSESSQE